MSRHAHPTLHKQLNLLSEQCDRVGMSGANIFNCSGYVAPIHSDNDATRGLCMQALLSANTAYKEFSFCNVEYRYYIETSTNCLWSFASTDLHGTMLPSMTTIRHLNAHAIDPTRAASMPSPSSSAPSSSAPSSSASSLAASSSAASSSAASSSAASSSSVNVNNRSRRPRRVAVAGSVVTRSRRTSANATQAAPRVAVSNGAHVAVPARNRNRAVQNARRRGQYPQRSRFWCRH
ncbi:hypothetical protein F5880DRAFT_1618394 [Lentinula raphanica]|nr:hypothetical protein F5880DRAFT_1618394 [Lentinula raphanica]